MSLRRGSAPRFRPRRKFRAVINSPQIRELRADTSLGSPLDASEVPRFHNAMPEPRHTKEQRTVALTASPLQKAGC